MGAARLRGSREERAAAAIADGRPKVQRKLEIRHPEHPSELLTVGVAIGLAQRAAAEARQGAAAEVAERRAIAMREKI